jgi:hypothetical protein
VNRKQIYAIHRLFIVVCFTVIYTASGKRRSDEMTDPQPRREDGESKTRWYERTYQVLLGAGRIASQREREYARPERLADVMALLQVLALAHRATHRSEEELRKELQGSPRSADTWKSVAKDHPEFFRVNPDPDKTDKNHIVSLIARHVSPKREDGKRGPLTDEFVGNLLRSAVDIHDRQVRRSERWTYLVPIWVALILGILGLLGTLAKLLLGA